MNQQLKSALTLLTVALLLVLGGVWGFHAMIQPFPSRASSALCTPRELSAGTQLYPAEVLVNVYNASTRGGLATRAMSELVARGFAEGLTGNSLNPSVKTAVIWAEDPEAPDVRLVLKHLGAGAKVVKHAPLADGVTVLVGPDFKKLAVKPKGVTKARVAGTICSPPTS